MGDGKSTLFSNKTTRNIATKNIAILIKNIKKFLDAVVLVFLVNSIYSLIISN
jgi:hypothetical protein